MKNAASYNQQDEIAKNFKDIKNKSEAKVEELSEQLANRTDEISKKIKTSAGELTHDMKEYGDEFYDLVKKHPGKFLAVAAIGALGALIFKH